MTTISGYIDAIVGEFLAKSEPTAREVSDVFLKRHKTVVSEFGVMLAERQIRTMIAERMKKVVQASTGKQQEFDFGIVGIPSAITFEDGNDFRYISIQRATDRHLVAYCRLLEKQIAADSSRLKNIRDLRRKLSPIFKSFPGITVAQAVRKMRKEAA